ncbi:MAG TPA: Wzz/FepE/Etk N-terminal domain-containing protein [Bryobacteraceae bacterium]|nr:Wzz/FepE/Etk N-terminal domain-containing protein [Bryobacteraceae bacterium]
MTDSLNIFELLDHLRTRWRFIAAVVVAALIVAGAGCLLAPRRYTATATVVIDPPGGGDPRTASSVSPIYLESLKSYEQFASSDTLFLKACLKFGLLDESSGTTIERFKRRVLRVEKLKDTRLLEISATLPEARRAQELAQYIAEETVALSRDLSRDGDLKLIESLSGQLEPVRLTLDRARTEAAGLSSRLGPMEEESRYLTELLVRTRQQLVEATAEASDLAAQEAALSRAGPDRDERASTELAYVRQRAAGARARQAALEASRAEVEREAAEKAAAVVELRARRETAEEVASSAESKFKELQARVTELTASAGLHTEQLRIVDPGIVPQRPSFPDIPLILAAALSLSFIAAFALVSLQFGMSRKHAPPARVELKVARGGGR